MISDIAYVASQPRAIDFHGHNMTAIDNMEFHGRDRFSSDHCTGLMDRNSMTVIAMIGPGLGDFGYRIFAFLARCCFGILM